ncbi:MAG: adenine nucleotide alpha hydrolase family protein [Thermodesulfovibrio sp.]|nr:adenine nucleotide alpha hydrolase family protein [Thermodesulfovibrio sp.]
MEFKRIKCKFCSKVEKGIVLKHYNLKVCLNCFPIFFRKRVSETIKKFSMFTPSDSIIVAISGGKDSISITKTLRDLGYNIKALHIDTKIENISQRSKQVVEKFCFNENIPLKIINLYEEIEASVEELSRISGKPICAICGMIRRYLINKEAKGDIVVTGHTLNDEVSFILKNMLFWNDELLSRTYPVLQEKEGLSKKVKPLCMITEEETLAFCKILNIEYVEEPCPYKPEIYDIFKTTVKNFNDKFPGSILGFYKGFLKRIDFYSSTAYFSLQSCQRCGYPTTASLCSVCRLKEKLLQYRHG